MLEKKFYKIKILTFPFVSLNLERKVANSPRSSQCAGKMNTVPERRVPI